MPDFESLSQDYRRVEQAIRYLEENVHHQPPLSEIAASIGLGEFHFQRLFSRWVGISPKRFLQYLTKEHAKRLLEGSGTVLEAAYAVGLSGPSRLHDLLVACEAVTPGEHRRGGEGMSIRYGYHPSPFGDCLLAVTSRGICALRFDQGGGRESLVEWLAGQWPRAALASEPDATGPLIRRIFPFPDDRAPAPLHIHVKGTNFQIRVWEALVRIPFGQAVTYEDLARHLGIPRAARAVGNAVGANPIPFLIPCHRVLRKAGEFGNYGEGPARKKAILGWEAARVEAASGFSRLTEPPPER